MDPQSSKKGLTYGIVIAVLIIAVIAAIAKYSFKKTDEVASTTDTTPTSTTTSEPSVSPVTTESPEATAASNSTYKDGNYSATGVYVSPGGGQKLNVSLTLKNDIITSVSATSGAVDHESQEWQNRFLSGYKTQVIGKNIADIKLDKVSGSSLTPRGFNDAIAQIRTQAKA